MLRPRYGAKLKGAQGYEDEGRAEADEPGGEEAQMIGEVREQPESAVLVTTLYGGSRIVDMLVGDPLPRIC